MSHDVEQLFPRISQKIILATMREVFEKHTPVQDLLNFTVDQLLEMLNVVLQTTYVNFKGIAYAQKTGVPAGSPISTYVCDAVLNKVDLTINKLFGQNILAYYRYLDDICSGVKDSSKIPQMLAELNRQDSSLKFTYEIEKRVSNNEPPSLPFLDVRIVNDPTGCYCRHYIKPSQTSRTINYRSAHPPGVFKAILEGEINRAFSHCSKSEDKKNQSNRILQKYLKNDYPEKMVCRALSKWRPPVTPLPPPPKKQNPEFWVSVPYCQGLFELAKKCLKELNVGVCSAPITTIKSLCQKKWAGKVEKMHNTEVVYAIPCQNCKKLYVGQTGRSLQDRTNEHQRAVRLGKDGSGLAKHKKETGHDPNFEGVSIVFKEKNTMKRMQLEAATIAANDGRLLNLSPANLHMLGWWEVFKAAYPDYL